MQFDALLEEASCPLKTIRAKEGNETFLLYYKLERCKTDTRTFTFTWIDTLQDFAHRLNNEL